MRCTFPIKAKAKLEIGLEKIRGKTTNNFFALNTLAVEIRWRQIQIATERKAAHSFEIG
jgi:hypothetical protein